MESYQSTQSSLEETQKKLEEVQSYYEGDDNSPSAKLTDEVTAWLEDKITEAESIVEKANSDNLKGSAEATKITGEDAEIYLNGAKFTSNSNTFEINGLTITCNAETGDEAVTLTTQEDTSGIYDMIKNFIKEYSELINEMDKLYNAESAKGYEP